MPWTVLDDGFWDHPKVVRAGNAATGAFVRMLNWSKGKGTNGLIPRAMATSIASKSELETLLRVVLLDAAGDDLQVHDFADWNWTSEEARARSDSLSMKRSEAGKAGNARRWGHRKDIAKGVAIATESIANESQNSSQKSRKSIAPFPFPDPREINPPTASQLAPPGGSAAAGRGKHPRPDIAASDLSPAESAVAGAVAADPSLAPIVARPNELARDLCAAGPGLDVPAVVGDAGRWLRANPTRAKKNGAQFLLGWVKREQERRGGRSPAPQRPVIQPYAGPSGPPKRDIPPPDFDFSR